MYKKIYLFLFVMVLISSFVLAGDLDGSIVESSPSGDTGQNSIVAAQLGAQTFKVGITGTNSSFSLTGVGIKGYIQGTPPTYLVKIYAVNTTGDINSTVLSQNTSVSLAHSGASPGIFTNVTLPATNLQPGVPYALAIETVGGTGSDNWKWRKGAGLYAGGAGYLDVGAGWVLDGGNDYIFIVYGTGLGVDLVSPSDGSGFIDQYEEFNATINEGSNSLTSTKINIWDADGDLFYEENQSYTPGTGTVQYNITGFTPGTYSWNVQVNGTNSTSDPYTEWASANYSFTWGYVIINSSFNTSVYETESQSFYYNLTVGSSVNTITSELYYNGTNYPASSSCSGTECILEATIDVTNIGSGGASESKDFFFQAELFTDTTSFLTNLSSGSQTVNEIHFEECGTYTQDVLNFTAYDESNLTRINPYDFDGYFEYWLGSGLVTKNISFQNSSVPNMELCIYPGNRTFYINSNIDYGYEDENITYNDRTYYMRNSTVSNTTSQNIDLYLLNSEVATSFILEVVDQTQQAVPGVLIYIQRFYPGLGVFKTVQTALTDDNGKSVGFYETETVDYKHIITQNGTVVLDTSAGRVFAETSPAKLIFTIGTSLTYPWEILEEDSDITTSLNWNSTTQIISFAYVDTSGETQHASLQVYLNSLNETERLICESNSTQSSATLTCNLSAYDSGYFIAMGYIGQPNIWKKIINFTISSALEVFDLEGLFWGWLIILTITLAFIWNPTAMIVAHNIATIFVAMLGLVAFSPVYIFALIAISVLAIVLMRT